MHHDQMKLHILWLFTLCSFSAAIYDDIHAFKTGAGLDLLFDLNVALRDGDNWDSTNAIKIINYTVEQGYTVEGWELGNGITISDKLLS